MRQIFGLLAVMAIVLAVAPAKAEAADSRYGKQKVVYHINYNGGEDDKLYRGAMRNIQNHINAVGADNLDIKVVFSGGALPRTVKGGRKPTGPTKPMLPMPAGDLLTMKP